jgi:hypothetical protein
VHRRWPGREKTQQREKNDFFRKELTHGIDPETLILGVGWEAYPSNSYRPCFRCLDERQINKSTRWNCVDTHGQHDHYMDAASYGGRGGRSVSNTTGYEEDDGFRC